MSLEKIDGYVRSRQTIINPSGFLLKPPEQSNLASALSAIQWLLILKTKILVV
ncbi:MAG TPA: hypothetical protein V6D14_28800 [Coleofasciculaceae cyanobacterium]|jgi:hypothetical protein